ncbi:MAG TPA: recombinase family protein [Candidatus Acidoferrales bacterium]|nr:recombinase family protein [Candidatus Acidoferrales bacterium]
MTMRCAIYARYSSDRQSPASIADQIRKCGQYAKARGWEVLSDHIYSDQAISGATLERAGLKLLLAAAQTKAFDVVLIDDTSRLSRQLADAINLSDRLAFAGVRVVFVSQGIDSQSEQAEVLLATHGIVDSLYIRELAKKTFRGVEGRVLERLHSGGRIFGYRSVPIEDPKRRDAYGRAVISGVRLRVDEAQARIVRKIFSLYASGLSIKAVAKRMNGERAESPRPRKGREQSWARSSIRVILRNERYRGSIVWARTKKIRNPQTGRRVQRLRPETEWVRVEVPDQRIVSEKLWLAVRDRLAFVNGKYGAQGRKGGLMNRSASSPYIFSGLLKCGVCGANYIIVSGAGKNHASVDYGCSAHASRGTCKNARRISRDSLEAELLAKLQQDILCDAAIDYLVERVEEEIEKRFAELDGEVDAMRRRKVVLESEIENLSRAIAGGPGDVPSLRKAIVEREAELSRITAKTLGRKKGSLQHQVEGLRKFVRETLRDVRGLLTSKHANPAAIRQELARYIDVITLYPEAKGDSIRYKGGWKVLGGRECAEGQS